MFEMPLNEGQETVAAFLMDLQLHADDAGDAGGSAVDGGGGADTGAGASSADEGAGGSGDEAGTDGSGVVDQNVDDSGEVPGAVKEQSPEANKAFAEMRKQKQAAEKAAQQAKEAFQKEQDSKYAEKFGHLGIFTEQQYWAAVDREKQQKLEAQRQAERQRPRQYYDELIAKGYDPKVAEGLAKGLATEIRLQQVEAELANRDAQTKREKEQEKITAQRVAMGKQVVEDHKALTKKYGDLVPPLETLLEDLDEGTKELMRNGAPLKAAWLASHEDEILEFAKKTGANKALKNVDSKAHLQSEQSGAGDLGKSIELTPGQIQAYRNTFGQAMTITEMKKREAVFRKKRGK